MIRLKHPFWIYFRYFSLNLSHLFFGFNPVTFKQHPNGSDVTLYWYEFFIHGINKLIEYLIVQKLHCNLCLFWTLILNESKSLACFALLKFGYTYVLNLTCSSEYLSQLVMWEFLWKILYIDHAFVNLWLINRIRFECYSTLHLTPITRKFEHLRGFYCLW